MFGVREINYVLFTYQDFDLKEYIYIYIYVCVCVCVFLYWGAAVAEWLRCCATNRKVAGSIPAGVSGFFIDIKSF